MCPTTTIVTTLRKVLKRWVIEKTFTLIPDVLLTSQDYSFKYKTNISAYVGSNNNTFNKTFSHINGIHDSLWK